MIKEIIEEVSEELNIPKEQVKEIYEFKQRWLKEKMKKKSHLQILDTGLGVYCINYQNLNKKIKNLTKRRNSGLLVNQTVLNQLNELKTRLHNFNVNRKRKEEKRALCTN